MKTDILFHMAFFRKSPLATSVSSNILVYHKPYPLEIYIMDATIGQNMLDRDKLLYRFVYYFK